MSVVTERALAMMAAEDGELHEADKTLTRIIERLEHEMAGHPSDHSITADCVFQPIVDAISG